MSSFTELGVPAQAVRALAKRGITAPFPIQSATIGDALAGRDLCGKAPTGSGKTLAFAIPVAMRSGAAKPRRPRTLILVPTRELAAQVHAEIGPLADALGRTVASFFGGTSIPRDKRRLDAGVDIAVACPGRLADLVQQKAVHLGDVDLVVIDEADRMADMGFLPEVRRLIDQTAPRRQTLLFSATLDGDVDVLVQRYQRDPVTHDYAPLAEERSDVRHLFWRTDPFARTGVTGQLIRAAGPAIVFTRTKHGADRLARALKRDGVDAVAIHANLNQNQRTRALADFTSGRARALIATDIAARGIHVEGVGLVLHYDPPMTDKDYVHRSGRTGRAGADGLVVTLVVPEKAKDVESLQRALGLPVGAGPAAVDRLRTAAVAVSPSPQPGRRDRPAEARTGAPRRTPRPERSAGPRRPTGLPAERPAPTVRDDIRGEARDRTRPAAGARTEHAAQAARAAGGGRPAGTPPRPQGEMPQRKPKPRKRGGRSRKPDYKAASTRTA